MYCTEEQTRKALELGAPIKSKLKEKGCDMQTHIVGLSYIIPTAEQMISWLEEQGFYFYIMNDYNWQEEVQYGNNWYHSKENLSSRKEATLSAIDAALEYLNK